MEQYLVLNKTNQAANKQKQEYVIPTTIQVSLVGCTKGNKPATKAMCSIISFIWHFGHMKFINKEDRVEDQVNREQERAADNKGA